MITLVQPSDSKYFLFSLFRSDILHSPNQRQKTLPQIFFAPSFDRLSNQKPSQQERQLNRSQTTPISIAQRQRSQQTCESNTPIQQSHPHRFNVQKVNISSHSDSDEESRRALPNYSMAWFDFPTKYFILIAITIYISSYLWAFLFLLSILIMHIVN